MHDGFVVCTSFVIEREFISLRLRKLTLLLHNSKKEKTNETKWVGIDTVKSRKALIYACKTIQKPRSQSLRFTRFFFIP